MSTAVSKITDLEKLVRQAGEKLISFWPANINKTENQLGIEVKSDGSSVTKADFASNQIIVSGLQSLFPDCSILSEELPITSEIVAERKIWIIDPLDGTKSFINGRDDFSILIGLAIDNKIQFGMMYFPARDILAYAEVGQGALISGKKSKVSDSLIPRPNSIYFRNYEPPSSNIYYREVMDSGLAFLSVCTGDFDGVILRMTTHKEWDLAAPAAMILESGGMMTDEKGNIPKFGTGEITYKYLIASNGKVHQQLLDSIS